VVCVAVRNGFVVRSWTSVHGRKTWEIKELCWSALETGVQVVGDATEAASLNNYVYARPNTARVCKCPFTFGNKGETRCRLMTIKAACGGW